MRPNRADSALSQYFCSLLTTLLLLVSLLCGLIFFATTRTFAASVLSSSEKESQHKTEWNAAQIQADFALSDAALAPLSGACAAYQAELAVYWHDFFRTDAEELPAAPAPSMNAKWSPLSWRMKASKAAWMRIFVAPPPATRSFTPSRSLSSDIPSPSGRA